MDDGFKTRFGGNRRYAISVNWGLLKDEVGFDGFDAFSPEAEVSSPRSVRACAKEGILPEELTFKPPELFFAPGVMDAVAEMRYEFAEARRKDLLQLALATYQKDLHTEEEEVQLFGGLDCREPPIVLENTVAFFRERLEDISPEAVSSQSPRKLAERGIPYKEPKPTPSVPLTPVAKTRAFARTWSAPGTLGAGSGDGLDGLGDGLDPLATLTPSEFAATTGRLWTASSLGRTPKESGAIVDNMLRQFRTVPRADRIEEDGATVMQNHIQTKRVFDERMRRRDKKKELQLVSKRGDCSIANFRDVFCDREEGRQKIEFRHAMSLPPSRQGEPRPPSFIRADNARDKVHHEVALRELKWLEELQHQTEKHHHRTERLTEDYYMRKMRCARTVMSDRIRWRFQHDEVRAQREAYEEEKLRLFLKREEDMRNRKAKAANDNTMRQELRRLREVSRLMDEQRRLRRANYWKEVKDGMLAVRRSSEAAIDEAAAAEALAEPDHEDPSRSDSSPSGLAKARCILPHLARSKMMAVQAA